MKKILTKGRLASLIIVGVLVIDQLIKIWVKTHMHRYESIRVTDWFYIYFTENNGMAFGVELFAKLFLTSFRILAVAAIVWYLVKVIRANYRTGYIACLAFIVAGAAGNILDSVFYGEIFSESTYTRVAHFVPIGEGYSSWLYGKVVDMFYFPLLEWNWPSWLPFVGGQHFIFFSPIFNFADAAISCGVFALIMFYRKCLR